MLSDKDLDVLIKKAYHEELNSQHVPLQAYKNCELAD